MLNRNVFDEIFWCNFFDHNFEHLRALNLQEKEFNIPANVWTDDKKLVIEISTAGIDNPTSDIEINAEGDLLRFKYSKKAEDSKEISKRVYHIRKITSREFDFTLKINQKYDLKNVHAKIESGLLKVTLIQAPDKIAKKISIE